jgi:hypothetical protein
MMFDNVPNNRIINIIIRMNQPIPHRNHLRREGQCKYGLVLFELSHGFADNRSLAFNGAFRYFKTKLRCFYEIQLFFFEWLPKVPLFHSTFELWQDRYAPISIRMSAFSTFPVPKSIRTNPA